MTLEEMKILLQIAVQAECDPDFQELKEAYKAAYQPFWELWQAMPEEDNQIIDDYLHAAVELYQHLIVLALRHK